MAIFALVGLGEDLDRHRYQIVQSKRPFDSYSLRWEGRRRVGEGIHCTALEQVTRKILDAYTVRTRVRVHAYGYTFIARYAHDSTVTVRGHPPTPCTASRRARMQRLSLSLVP